MHSNAPLLCVFLFCGALVGAAAARILSRLNLPVPYAVVVFLLGVVFAAFSNHFYLGDVDLSMGSWTALDPELLLFLFLPVLVFGESMNLKWYVA
jgi:NhaP-type Na+/H+ or K+/H+ antiporter